ncbi:MAG: hypothetical protein V1913_10235 [Fibrobacterota bacterium]
MKTITMLEFRKNSEQVVNWARQGLRMVMTYRGKPVLRLEPIREAVNSAADDPFYHLSEKAEKNGGNLSNHEMDRLIYGA